MEAKRFEFHIILFHSVSLPVSIHDSEYDTDLVVPAGSDANQLKWIKTKSEKYLKAVANAGL